MSLLLIGAEISALYTAAGLAKQLPAREEARSQGALGLVAQDFFYAAWAVLLRARRAAQGLEVAFCASAGAAL